MATLKSKDTFRIDTTGNKWTIGQVVICNGIEDEIEFFLDNDEDGYDVQLKENGTQTFGCLTTKLNT